MKANQEDSRSSSGSPQAETFRRIALGMPRAIESQHMNHPDFRADGRIFATIHHDHKWGMVALTPEQQQKFVRESPRVFVPENGAWGRAGCTKVLLSSVDEDTLGEAMTLAWQNAITKTKSLKRATKKRISRKS